MKKVKPTATTITYPFSDQDPPAYKCRCGILLRKSNLHQRVYNVSLDDQNFIITTKPHICIKDRSKRK